MIRTRAYELRAAFAASPEPCVWRWFAEQEQQSAHEPARERDPDPLTADVTGGPVEAL